MMETNEFDLVIVGAGLVGLSVIAGLQNSGLRLLVLEKKLPITIDPQTMDYRPLTLALGSQRWLASWGLWEKLAERAVPIQQLHVSQRGRFGRVLFQADQLKAPALAYVVPFDELHDELFQFAKTQTDVTFRSIHEINHIACDKHGVQLTYSSEEARHTVSARLLIAADGSHSRCRELLGVSAIRKNSEETALIATVTLQAPHENTAYQRFVSGETLALLPLLNPNHYRLVWTASNKKFSELREKNSEELMAFVAEAFGGRLPPLESLRIDAHYPLETILAEQTIGDSFVLLGNAAHTIYPIAAQGFNLGLQDTVALTRVLKRSQPEINTLATLEKYLELRQSNQDIIVQSTAWIQRAFKWRWPMLSHFRGLGLFGIDALPSLKQSIAHEFCHDK